MQAQIDRILLLPLGGPPAVKRTVTGAIGFLANYRETDAAARLSAKYEIQIRYSNGDSITGVFELKFHAIEFLQFIEPPLRPKVAE